MTARADLILSILLSWLDLHQSQISPFQMEEHSILEATQSIFLVLLLILTMAYYRLALIAGQFYSIMINTHILILVRLMVLQMAHLTFQPLVIQKIMYSIEYISLLLILLDYKQQLLAM